MTRYARLVLLALLTVLFTPSSLWAQKKTEKAPAADAAKTDPVDINSATEAQLKELPGIGDAYSKKIVAGRPYANKTQLVSRGILPQATYDKVADKIIAKQAKK